MDTATDAASTAGQKVSAAGDALSAKADQKKAEHDANAHHNKAEEHNEAAQDEEKYVTCIPSTTLLLLKMVALSTTQGFDGTCWRGHSRCSGVSYR